MAEGIPFAFPVDLTRKWRALAERRKAHLVDLYDSGRWRRYYSEKDFILRLREAIRAVERWSATEEVAARETAMAPSSPAEAMRIVLSGDSDADTLSGLGAADHPRLGDTEEATPPAATDDDESGGEFDWEMLFAPEAERRRKLA
ncbi:MAG: TIGR03809 family protein [Xanthobacteraceae bacterium]